MENIKKRLRDLKVRIKRSICLKNIWELANKDKKAISGAIMDSSRIEERYKTSEA